MLGFVKRLLGEQPDLAALITNGALIIDVRTAKEFATGHVSGSINIPLDQINNHIKDISGKDKPVITCCASGMRSGVAMNALKKHGVEAYNGGGWKSVDRLINS